MRKETFGGANVLDQLTGSLRRLIDLERLHLHRPEQFRDRSRETTFDTRYLPENCGAFQLPCFWVRQSHFYIYGRQVNSCETINFFDGTRYSDSVLMPIHPAELER